MARGFKEASEFDRIVGWELWEVGVNKHHVMFWFDEWLGFLDIAHAFSYRSADGHLVYKYELYGPSKTLNVDRILHLKINSVTVRSEDSLDLQFSNGDVLTVHDDLHFQSWWFFRYQSISPRFPDLSEIAWKISDDQVI